MKTFYIYAAMLVATFVALAVLCGGNIGAAFVILAILLFGVGAMVMCSVPTKPRNQSRSPELCIIREYNRFDADETLKLVN